MKYRKRPVVVDAVQYLGVRKTDSGLSPYFDVEYSEWPKWLDKYIESGIIILSNTNIDGVKNTLIIFTLEGDMSASIGDYIIEGVAGEVYPCKPDIFKRTYELAN